ncbi:5607_t:CDS:10 [Funneliformis mosseae]|uniref:5607_t:CDS:1 n=1 Tax=Funneliformis mosseae TaxID=27381 RepID=A0A9N8W377_FUNMO|nr:5607_t:CDS:10 [Funneliformis mosseae]
MSGEQQTVLRRSQRTSTLSKRKQEQLLTEQARLTERQAALEAKKKKAKVISEKDKKNNTPLTNEVATTSDIIKVKEGDSLNLEDTQSVNTSKMDVKKESDNSREETARQEKKTAIIKLRIKNKDFNSSVNSKGKETATYKGKSKVVTSTKSKKAKKQEGTKAPQYVPGNIDKLASMHPDNYWQFHAESNTGMINYINVQYPLQLINVDVRDQGPITGMTLSPDGTMLVTFCNVGAARIWDTREFKLIQKLRDTEEKNIDEFFVGKFIHDQTRLVVGGKLKDRNRWSEEDDDNHILPCPLKIFDTISGKVIVRLEGHSEEVLCIKNILFKGEPYFLTTSQDGYIIKWKLQDDWTTLINKTRMEDGITCMAFTVSFVPNTGNRYFMAATDEHVRLYDFDAAQLVQTFSGNMYSQYCDCAKFIYPVEPLEEDSDYNDNVQESSSKATKKPLKPKFAYLITRGVEILDAEGGKIASRVNVCILHKLIFPTKKGGSFTLEEIRRYYHKDYHSNSWLIKISSNGRYIAAPTMDGGVFIFNLRTGQVTSILRDYDDLEVRDVIFHPWKPLLFTYGCVKIYTYSFLENNESKDVEIEKED